MFQPDRLLIDHRALDLPMTKRIIAHLPDLPLEILEKPGHMPNVPKGGAGKIYAEAKRILLVGLHPGQPLRDCRPSADFELALGASCPGLCQYCYLQGTLGPRPYVRVYADLAEILAAVTRTLEQTQGEVSFEAASTSDPLAVEHLTGAVAETISFFGGLARGRLRLVTKYAQTGGLLELAHRGHTRIRFSLNTEYVVRNFEAGTDPVTARIKAANELGRAGYPIGFVLAPLLIYPGWEDDYGLMLEQLYRTLQPELHRDLTFELIAHRFTAKSKEIIQARFPRCRLDLDETRRRIKYGRYGRRKFVYPSAELKRLWERMRTGIARYFPAATIAYET